MQAAVRSTTGATVLLEIVRILFLSQRVPFPPNRGDKITTWRIIERLRRHHDVTCVAFEHGPEDAQATTELRGRGFELVTAPHRRKWAAIKCVPRLLGTKPLTTEFYGHRRLQHEVDRLVANTDLAYAFSSSMGAYLLRHHSIGRVMHFAELDSDKWSQYASRTSGVKRWVYAREARTLGSLERTIAYEFDDNVVCTALEQQLFQQQLPGAPSSVLRNGVDVEYYQPSHEQAGPHNLVFTGVMDYFPNVDGCAFFAREIFPQVRRTFPDATFTIVGSNPTPDVTRLQEIDGVRVTGFVTDTREYLRQATACVAPLRIARGIQNKVLEGMAMGLPVVGTTSATQGVGGEHGRDYLVADTVDEQVAAISRLFDDPPAARSLGDRARRFVVDHYGWESSLEALDRIIERTVTRRRHRDPAAVPLTVRQSC